MAIGTRNYIRGVPETPTKVLLEQSDGSLQYVKRDGVLKNGFADLLLYYGAGGSTAVPLTAYNSVTLDQVNRYTQNIRLQIRHTRESTYTPISPTSVHTQIMTLRLTR